MAVAFFIPQIVQPQAAVFAATQSPPSPTPHVINGFSTAPIHLTLQEIALNNEKQQLANEYTTVRHGKEPLAVFEQHMIAYMNKYHLGNTANLHTVLTRGNPAKARLVAQMTAQGGTPNCPSLATKGGTPATICRYPTGAAQFPEEQFNWCGNAAASTIGVENSFQWPGANTNGSNVLSYNPYVTSQSQSTATSDEYMLAVNYFGNANNGYGVNPGPMTTVLNDFAHGHGGNYVLDTNIGDFQNDMVSDISQGWDLADGISIPYVTPYEHSLFGYAVGAQIAHWLPVTYDTNGGATTYYADPVYNSQDYLPSNGWNVNGPYASLATSSLMNYTFVFSW